MKFVLIFGLVAAAIGGWIGWASATSQYQTPGNQFGPFGVSAESDQKIMDEFIEKAHFGAGAKAEIIGGDTYDFGVMLRNASASHEFEIKNVGTGTLTLRVLGSTCKCTVGSLTENELEPGESTTVKLEWTAKTNSRTFSQSANLRTNDPEHTELSLLVQGKVVELVAAEPAAWNLGEIAGTNPLILESTLFNHSEQGLEIESAEWLSEAFESQAEIQWQAREVDVEKDGVHGDAREAFDMQIVVQPPVPQGALRETLRIRYKAIGDEEEHPPLDLPVSGKVVGALSVLGGRRLYTTVEGVARLNLGETDSDTPLENKVFVTFRGEHRNTAKLTVGKIDPADALEAELGEPEDRGTMTLYPLIIRTKEGAPTILRNGDDRSDFGSVTVTADTDEVAPLRISIVFNITDPKD